MMEENEIRILVIDRGFVLVCRCPDPTGYPYWLPATDCRTIRRWGTTGRGLGQLCSGPTTETILDDLVPFEKIPVRAIVLVLEGVDQDKWAPLLLTTPAPRKEKTRGK